MEGRWRRPRLRWTTTPSPGPPSNSLSRAAGSRPPPLRDGLSLCLGLECLTRLASSDRAERNMGPSGIAHGGTSGVDDAVGELRGAALFKLIWDSVSDVLGTSATATLLRRAALRARARSPELAELTVLRTDAG